eukprot:CAMPEP_0175425190 /NCGR_PEP_ID=MMETSP0095-20121207/49171_1 /TAXON_ID=311494 /ORGANISM="Alexandrium monilatum, Strain CCMP3105" /LENGTH=32 /DNA_ID= /DNA_START= /DNA_END= /DNA_ORIENTATION=
MTCTTPGSTPKSPSRKEQSSSALKVGKSLSRA